VVAVVGQAIRLQIQLALMVVLVVEVHIHLLLQAHLLLLPAVLEIHHLFLLLKAVTVELGRHPGLIMVQVVVAERLL
jgi:hypothetical protein